ncbi:hypothetical protein J7E83_06105 [Arthrobacter sp. ISL-48]|uniref:sunset domain-containing protein n=1 Tax=Arthrobacter sp. ISL-48 TaxID=2819110 RepID=UPI001BEA5BEA|nr:hypothetical protein [Arthrobacter sp. ISL-48]MBT2531700.1 hypothetical protein [Arthrobacter sp. ISL-48]
MDFVFWIIVIVLIVGVVWWLLNRSSSARNSGAGRQDQAGSSAQGDAIRADGAMAGGSAAASADAAATAGIPSAAGFGRPAEPVSPTTADDGPVVSAAAPGLATEPAPRSAGASVGAPGEVPADGQASPAREDQAGQDTPRLEEDSSRQESARTQEDAAEWETQWSEASESPAAPHADYPQSGEGAGTTDGSSVPAAQVHHPEYTGPHTPTLPGAESAAGESADESTLGPALTQTQAVTRTDVPGGAAAAPGVPDNAPEAETMDRTQSSAAVETAASHTEEPAAAGGAHGTGAEPVGHLAADQPYGQGSASPGPNGRGPADYTVKGDAGSMVYYEEGHPDYEQTRAEVWFESAAHAEAAGFRAPRRNRL